ncbi:MAG TPA: J domain-containing protein [Acidimicrobiales bacterium]|nr:J domain-containing protein [Acidimicrobiales bacterium]
MEIAEARTVLGVAPHDDWPTVRAAYRRAIRTAHPDLHGGTTAAAVRLNEAYGVLRRAWRDGTPSGPGAPGPPVAPPPPVEVAMAAGDALLLGVPADEAFAVLLEAAHRIGNVSYVDRSCAIFEVVVDQDGEACSLLVTLQGRAHGTEALLTLEALERPASLPPGRVLARLLAALGAT